MARRTTVEVSDALRMLAAADMRAEHVDLVLRAADTIDAIRGDLKESLRLRTKLEGVLENIAELAGRYYK